MTLGDNNNVLCSPAPTSLVVLVQGDLPVYPSCNNPSLYSPNLRIIV
jgi:hypothetical protein